MRFTPPHSGKWEIISRLRVHTNVYSSVQYSTLSIIIPVRPGFRVRSHWRYAAWLAVWAGMGPALYPYAAGIPGWADCRDSWRRV